MIYNDNVYIVQIYEQELGQAKLLQLYDWSTGI